MKKDLNYYAQEFVEGLLEQQRGIWESLGRPYIKKQEKRYSRAVEKLIEAEEGVEELIKLLSHKSPTVALTAAVYLLDTSAEMSAVEVLREYAKGPEEDFHAHCARLRLADWKKQKAQKR
jgi:hypothetical protein